MNHEILITIGPAGRSVHFRTGSRDTRELEILPPKPYGAAETTPDLEGHDKVPEAELMITCGKVAPLLQRFLVVDSSS